MNKSKIKEIFEEHWDEFLKLNGKRVKNVKVEIDKMLKCKDIRHGYIEFKCDKCNTSKKVRGINLISRKTSNEDLYYLYNVHADVTMLVNKAGDIKATYYYDAFK